MELFTKESVLGVWQVLLDWAASFCARVDPTAHDWELYMKTRTVVLTAVLLYRFDFTTTTFNPTRPQI